MKEGEREREIEIHLDFGVYARTVKTLGMFDKMNVFLIWKGHEFRGSGWWDIIS